MPGDNSVIKIKMRNRGILHFVFILEGRNSYILDVILVGACGLRAGNIYLICNCSGGGGGNSYSAHNCSRLICILDRKGAEVSAVYKVGCVDIGALDVVAESITGADCPRSGVGLRAGGSQVARSIGNGGNAI
ncbi:MAG: hypothetical protein UW88_C0010G0015 [Candidatus Collierbacteria bacterium GW2011_GWD2_45_10]|nr:MAG: hypothetical protein UW88_C0010G0015 [Candidatus Collierbacteria bacterium GW2011_GWD2_45_10]